jgi:hypothetical protein
VMETRADGFLVGENARSDYLPRIRCDHLPRIRCDHLPRLVCDHLPRRSPRLPVSC